MAPADRSGPSAPQQIGGKKMKRITIVVLGGLLLAGCAVQGPDYEHIAPRSNKAAVYVYRTYPTAGFGSAAQQVVNCGDYSVALGPGGYHRFSVEPGEILCSSHTENTAQVQFTAKDGEDYYVRQWFSMGWVLPHVFLEQVEPDAAQKDLQTCKRQ
jgi:hypothetical protein